MKVLAFDTSSKALSVALLEEENRLAELTLTIKKNHSITLMPTIEFLMTSIDWKPTDLDRIVVAEGPGSYTGLRIAVATAKTLAQTLKIDLVGVSSLLALVRADTRGIAECSDGRNPTGCGTDWSTRTYKRSCLRPWFCPQLPQAGRS